MMMMMTTTTTMKMMMIMVVVRLYSYVNVTSLPQAHCGPCAY